MRNTAGLAFPENNRYAHGGGQAGDRVFAVRIEFPWKSEIAKS
ncbi:hypothetical protein [Bradyrhizobium frederickii]|nr:hypothetical protein [Bradyrhizobium frederickii]